MFMFPVLLLLAQADLPLVEKAEEANVLLEDYAPCGLVSLYLICRMHKVPVAWDEMKELLGPAGPDGAHSFEQLSHAAAHLGLHPVGLRVNRAALHSLPMPAIVQVRSPDRPDLPSHLLVLLQASADGVTLLDAPFAPSFHPDSGFLEHWTGYILVFAPDSQSAQSLRTRSYTQTGLRTALWVWGGIGGVLLLFAFLVPPTRLILPRLRRSKRLLLVGFLLILLVVPTWFFFRFKVRSKPHCVFETTEINLGELAPGEHSISVSLTNPGDEPLHISAIKSSCTCAVVKHPKTVEARQRATIEVQVYVSPGPRSASLEISSNDPDGPKNVRISWYGTTKPFLIPALIQSPAVPFDRDYERKVRIAYPGGKTAIVPQFERFESASHLVDIQPGRNDPNARKYGRAGFVTDVQGELELHLRVKAPTKPQALDTDCKLYLKYGKSIVSVTLPILISFKAGPLTPDADSITFAAVRWEELKGQTRLLQVSLRDTKADILVGAVPEWLECKIVSRKRNKALLSLKIKDKPPRPFLSTNLRLSQSRGDHTALLLPIRVFAARG